MFFIFWYGGGGVLLVCVFGFFWGIVFLCLDFVFICFIFVFELLGIFYGSGVVLVFCLVVWVILGWMFVVEWGWLFIWCCVMIFFFWFFLIRSWWFFFCLDFL